MKLVAIFFVLLLISSISAASAASIISIDLDTRTMKAGEIIEINGSVESSLAGKPVGIELKDSEGSVILIRTVTTNSDGEFTLKFKSPSSASGDIDIMTSIEIDGQPFSESTSVDIIELKPVMDVEPDAEPEMTSGEETAFEPTTTTKSEAAQSSVGCGAGTVMVNGVCQLTQTSGTSTGIEPIYIVIAAVAVGGGAVGALFVLKRGSGTPKPRRQDPDEYEEEYLAKQKPRRKPARQMKTSMSCDNCGNKLKPTAKFCGSCGNKV